jgi:hypothetical protein
MTVIHYINVRMQNIPKVDELKVNWEDNIFQPFHTKYTYKTYHSDINYHMTLNTIFGAVILDTLSTFCNV